MMRYFGTSGYKTTTEVRTGGWLYATEGFGLDAAYVPVLGILCSEKRLAIPDVEGSRSPAVRDLPALVRATPRGSVVAVHYFTTNKNGLAEQVCSLYGSGVYDAGCKVLQLNVDWPPIAQLEMIRARMPDLQIILQMPRRATNNRGMADLEAEVKRYAGLIEYILIDSSGGEGVELDVSRTSQMLSAFQRALPGVGLSVAGGFSGHKFTRLATALKLQFPWHVSYDAETAMRHESELKSTLDINELHAYIKEGAKLLL